MESIAQIDLNEQDWRRLAQRIQRGNCVLLLGPGAAADPDDPQGEPLTVRLARSLAERLRPDAGVVNKDDLSHIAQLYHQQVRDRMELEMAAEDFYAPYDNATTDLHRELAELPFMLCINTTPDRFLYNAFSAAKKSPIPDFYHFRRTRASSLSETDAGHPIVYDLYGNRREPESLVLTENDLLDFLVNVIKGTPPLPPFILSRLSDLDTSFLFIGFGFQQWYVRILLHVLAAQGHRHRSLALEDASFFAHPDRRRTVVFFEQQHFIEFRALSWERFARDLKQRHAAFVAGTAAPAPTLPPDAPTVFLCHSHRDRERTAEIGQGLNVRGIGIWLDRKNLRGGDNWERQIPHVIEKQVNYVVVLQSQHMLEKGESYFYKEINAALERQKGFSDELRFLIPALIDPCGGLEKLSRLHTVDLTIPDGVQALADAILDDWQRRHRKSAA